MTKNEKKIIDEILRTIKKSRNIVILTHTNPDGDAIGSSLALQDYLISQGLNAKIYINGGIPDNLRFLNGASDIIDFNESLHTNEISFSDIIFILDLNDSSRLKSLENSLLNTKAIKIVIDHHIDPKDFADIYFVETEASSTGELIWKLIKSDIQYSLSLDAANALYVAIMTDTGSFRFPRTTEEVHMIVADLIRAGADPVRNYDEVYNQLSFEAVKLLGEGFANLESYCNGKLLIMTLTREIFERTGAKEEDVENFVERLLSIKGSVIGILITQVPDREELRISFRSKGDVSVRDLALKYEGGGHVNAAGARVYDSSAINKTKESLIKDVATFLS